MKVNLKDESTLRKLRVLLLICAAILLFYDPTYAQGATVGKLNTLKGIIQGIINVIFLIGVSWGAVRTAMALIGHKEGGLTYLLYLIIAIVVWVSINYFMTDAGVQGASGVGGK
ncbi:hypothetical protein [Pedobacter nutrimenti]|uniref:Nidogen G2 beta-barrel domain-containing protein n=1 Tax=Pedobacter nutrimenti TaxID=1241337 RepID=A0A318U628_9SPHI|nr:hypothetical protein [Pedobacter nutrimenti]PYF68443.1 hypothetical protein B0O44_11227 [Pedobacter nutrimenti]